MSLLVTATALTSAHVLADFVFQTQGMVRRKRRPAMFAVHIAVVALLSALALGTTAAGPGLAALGAITLAHATIDALKLWAVPTGWLAREPLAPLQIFMLDQVAHLVSIGAVALVWPSAFIDGVWPERLGPVGTESLIAAMIAVTGAIVATRVGALAIGLLMDGLSPAAIGGVSTTPADHQADTATARELRAGVWIGWLERSVVFVLVLLGQFGASGFIIASKSVLRFEYARKAEQSERVIIGTLASFGWAIGAGLLTSLALARLS